MFKKQQNRITQQSSIKYLTNQSRQLFSLFANTVVSSLAFRYGFLCTLFVWTLWLIRIGFSQAFANLISNWDIALTMVFGSIVAGGTSLGGGAVAFPIFTKVLHIPPHEALVFSLAIQSIGMSAASLTIIAMGIKVEWRFIRWASLGGIIGIAISSVFLNPVFSPATIKMSFTMILSSFAAVLIAVNKTGRVRNFSIGSWNRNKRIISFIVGVVGGMTSGLVGSGMDIISFSVLVLLFGICEKVSTPTSVILMAIDAIAGFFIHYYWVKDFIEPVVDYWLAAIPIVVVGAPLGAALCSFMKSQTITKILVSLIIIELITSVLFIPLNTFLISYSLSVFVLLSFLYCWLYQTSKKIV